jgi:hypothetical protein
MRLATLPPEADPELRYGIPTPPYLDTLVS